jgi:hypothetical protein
LAGDHVRFVGVGQRDDDIGIAGAGTFENFRIGGVSDYRANIQSVLQFAKNIRPPT